MFLYCICEIELSAYSKMVKMICVHLVLKFHSDLHYINDREYVPASSLMQNIAVLELLVLYIEVLDFIGTRICSTRLILLDFLIQDGR